MPRREFASVEALGDYAARSGMLYIGDWMPNFDKRRRQLSPEQYEVANVRPQWGRRMRTVLLVRKTAMKTILKAEWERDPRRRALAIKGSADKKK